MSTRVVDIERPYEWGTAIEVTQDKVINLRLRSENNLIIYDEWDNEIYVDLQLPSDIEPADAIPVWINTGRVLAADWWDYTGTIVVFKTTSWDNIKLLYADNGRVFIDNWTGTFKEIYLKWDVDALIQGLRGYIDDELAKKQDKLTAWANITIAEDPQTHELVISSTGWGASYTAWNWINIDANDEISVDSSTVALKSDLSSYIKNWSNAVSSASSGVELRHTTDSNNYEYVKVAPNRISASVCENWASTQYSYYLTWTSNNRIARISDINSAVSAVWDMKYSDFNWVEKTWTSITLDLASIYTPSANFTVNVPSPIKEGQEYILRVDNWATAYTMTLGTNIENPYSVDLTLTANEIDQFVFLAVDWKLELQPRTGAEWGNITWTLSNQTDLNTALTAKANDSNVVHLSWDETITWVKTFTANSWNVGWNPAVISPRMRINWQAGSNKFKSQLDIWKGNIKKWYLWYFEESGKNRFEFASEDTGVPFYLGLMPWQQNNLSIAITNQWIWKWWTSDTYSADKVFAVIWDLDNRIISSSTAPSSPTEWQLWYDTTNDVLKSYDGTQWNNVWGWWSSYTAWNWISIDANNEIAIDTTVVATQADLSTKQDTIVAWTNISIAADWKTISATDTTYTAWEWIEIKNWPDYSAMQWPAPTWYHVPSQDEWVALCGILTSTFSMASNVTTMGTYLKMSAAGYRFRWDSSVSTQGYGYYWSSTRYNEDYAYSLRFISPGIYIQHDHQSSNAFSVRCFKDSPVIPDNSWTTLYDWSSVASWAWVFRNSSLWLISVSWDWATWTTIQDKNLWATTVYNSWDTLSEANCGWYFQRWNNYMFPFTWTVTTSSTQVDASNYWPWNYYNSSTFITRSSSPYGWDSTDNWNLRWWETWVVTLNNAITNTGVTSVNWQTWYVSINELPSGWTNWQILMIVNWTPTWVTPS